jgi:hypothetical protein
MPILTLLPKHPIAQLGSVIMDFGYVHYVRWKEVEKNMNGTQTIPITTPDKSAAPQPSGTGSGAQVWVKLVDYFLSNVMKTVWSGFLFVGGLIFFRYFFSIGFMPELDLQASLTLLAACTLLAGIVFMSAIGLSFLPALSWIGNNELLKALWV